VLRAKDGNTYRWQPGVARMAQDWTSSRAPIQNILTRFADFVRRIFIVGSFQHCGCGAWSEQFSPGQVMDKLYLGLGAALYLLFVAWCIITPQK